MKKFWIVIMCCALLLGLVGCQSKNQESSEEASSSMESSVQEEGSSQSQESASLEPGTSWNCIDGYDKEGAEDSVWKYYFLDANDNSFNPMGGYEERNDGALCEWYPWEGSWVGVGFNKDMPDYLELNCDGESMTSVLGFVAPASGKYVITGPVYNPWDQNTDVFTVAKNDGTVVLTEDIRGYTAVNGYLTPTDVQLEKGDILYFYCGTTGEWVSSYVNVTMYFEPTDPSIYTVPEVVIPETFTFVPSAEADYSATKEFNTEGSVWVYASTTDGKTFTPAVKYDEPSWNDDGKVSAEQWYSENGTGIGFNLDAGRRYLEANVSESPENGGESMALGFTAPSDGTFVIAGYTLNMWGQDAKDVEIVYNGQVLQTVELVSEAKEFSVSVDMKEGEVVYVFGVSNSGWVSVYLDVYAGSAVQLTGQMVNDKELKPSPAYRPVAGAIASAVKDFSKETADGTWVYATTTDGVTYTVDETFDEPDWEADGKISASQWYSANSTGIGFNYSVGKEWIEANVSESAANGGEMAALGFKAPEDGTYTFTVYTQNLWLQDGGDIVVSMDGKDVDTIPFVSDLTEKAVTVSMTAGQVIYFHGTSNGGWVSDYLSVYVTQ